MNINIILNKIIKIFHFYIIVIFLLIMFSCRDKKEAFLFYNPDYYYVYEDEFRIYKSIKKKLNRNFYQVNEILVESFDTLPDTFKKKFNNKKSGFFYINNFLIPFLLKEDFLSTNGKFKLLTYNLPIIEIDKNNFSIFNIKIDPLILKEKIFKFLKRFSSKKDFSDCGLLINSNYSFLSDIIFSIKNDDLKFNILEIDNLNYTDIRDWLNQTNMKVVFLFGYEFNNFILNLNKNDFQNIIFLEFETKFGEITNRIKYGFNINWDLTINDALVSDEFKKFINTDKSKSSKYNYLVKNKNIISIEKYKIIKE